jgi:CRP/FNR family transcriptional regulator
MDDVIVKKIDEFFATYKKQHYKKGDLLIRAEDIPTGVFYLKSGFVKQYVISKKGDELVLNIYKPVSFFPMSWAINTTPNKFFFEAVDEVEVYKAPSSDVVSFIKNNPDVLFNLLSRVYRGTDGMLTRMSYLMSGDAYGRLLAELLIYAKRFGTGNKEIEVTVSEKELAAQAGMTRETVSREMKILKEKGILLFSRNTLVIPDLKKLEAELSDGV